MPKSVPSEPQGGRFACASTSRSLYRCSFKKLCLGVRVVDYYLFNIFLIIVYYIPYNNDVNFLIII